MNDTWKHHPIKIRLDGSYEIIAPNGYGYHVPDEGEYAPLFAQVDEFAKANPEQVTTSDAGVVISPEQHLENLKAYFKSLVRQRLNSFARTRDYDSFAVACTYAGSDDPKEAREGAYCVAMRTATWKVANALMDSLTVDGAPMEWVDIERRLPPLGWVVTAEDFA
jgi:hypothetical protein